MAGAHRPRMPSPPGDPRIRRTLLAYGCSALMEFASWLAILLVAYDERGAVGVGAASFAMLAPSIVLVPLAAGFGARLPSGRALSVMYACEAAACALTGVLVLAGAPLRLLVAGGALLTLAIGLARPVHFATLPLLAARPGDLVAANALSTVLDGFAIFVGFLVSGVVFEAVGPWLVLFGGAALSLMAALATVNLGLRTTPVPQGDRPEEIQAAFAGLAALRGSAGVLLLLLLIAGSTVVEGANDTLTVTFNDQVLGRTESTAGLLAGAYGLGVAVGGAVLAGLAHRPRLAPVIVAGALLVGAAQASMALLDGLALAVLVMLVVGIGVSLVVVAARTLLQRTTDDQVLARVLAIQEGVGLAGLTVGAVVGPLLVVWLGPARSFVPLGLVLALGALAYPLLRSLERSGRARAREVALLRQVDFLAALPPYELERLALAATWHRVPAGTPVITQGETGDAYYLVAQGDLQVSVDDVVRPHELGPGDGFGEIALVMQVPRTASVTARTQCDLLVLDAPVFIAAVTSSVVGSGIAARVVQEHLDSDATEAP